MDVGAVLKKGPNTNHRLLLPHSLDKSEENVTFKSWNDTDKNEVKIKRLDFNFPKLPNGDYLSIVPVIFSDCRIESIDK